MKITIENQAILKRLQDKQPTYSVTRWEEDHQRMERIRNNVCEYPYEFGDANSRVRYMMTTAQADPSESGYNSLPRIGGTSQGLRNKTSYASFNSQGQLGARGVSAKDGLLPVIRQAENLDENRIVLYKRSKQLGQGYYIVEISSNNTHLFIAAYDVESPESLLIELPERRA